MSLKQIFQKNVYTKFHDVLLEMTSYIKLATVHTQNC